MPQTSGDKMKALFADLGRPTLRGIRKCPKCGTVNGTRGNSCKNKSCDVVFRDTGLKRKAFTDACKIITPDYPYEQIYSVRLRDRGPDYRNFVRLPMPGTVTISDSDTSVNALQKCFVESCGLSDGEVLCPHIAAARRCFADSQLLPIKHSVLPSLNIPEESKEIINMCLGDNADALVQRVSSTSFVVRCDATQKHPLGLLHVMFFKPNKFESLDKRYLCACRPQKQIREEALHNSGNGAFDAFSRYCIHYYACVCAFASCEELSTEFDFILSQVANDLTPTLLSQLHLVSLPDPNNGRDIDGLDSSHISVEIMRENLSLLESIAGVDDATLSNVQGIEGVLAEQIIVANVDDNFSLSDAALDELTEADHQVCQIFSSNHNIQIQNSYAPPESDILITNGNQSKRRKEDDTTRPILTVHSRPIDSINSYSSMLFDKSLPERKNQIFRQANHSNGISKQPVSHVALVGKIGVNAKSSRNDEQPEKKLPLLGFEEWLAGINERINLLMNYGNPGTPDPITYMVYNDFFECLKDRIASGLKKKRLPNQTIVVHRQDASPRKTYTKHTWKITNLLQLMHIFQCNLVPLKPTQYFVKSSQNMYVEWLTSAKGMEEPGSKNQPIAPILHSTFLKIGKSDQTNKDKELSAFTIEWIPDLLPVSKMGELTIKFEFGHSKPRGNS